MERTTFQSRPISHNGVGHNGSQKSLGELFGDLMRDMSTLVRQELALAKTEMSDKASKAGRDIAMIAAGGAVAYAGLLVLLSAIVLAIGLVLPLWASALIVAVVVLVIGYVLVQSGLSHLRQMNLAPRQTVTTVREDVEYVKERVQ